MNSSQDRQQQLVDANVDAVLEAYEDSAIENPVVLLVERQIATRLLGAEWVSAFQGANTARGQRPTVVFAVDYATIRHRITPNGRAVFDRMGENPVLRLWVITHEGQSYAGAPATWRD